MSAYIFANGPLQAPIQPIAIVDQRYFALSEVKFLLSEEYMSFSNDDFKIVDLTTNAVAFLVSGKTISLRERKYLYDAANNPIWVMKHNLLKLFGTRYNFSSPNDTPLFTIKNHHRWFFNQGKKLSIDLPIGTIVLEASKLDKIAVVTLQSNGKTIPIARIVRPLHSVRNVVGNVQDYELTVARNVDISAMIALVIALDEQGEKQDKTQKTGGGIIRPGMDNGSHMGGAMGVNPIQYRQYPQHQYYRPQDLDAPLGQINHRF